VSYLTNFPFDKIKIDKSFTQGVLNRRDCAAVVSSVLALAHGLGTVTTAEGVETEEQLEYMRNAGVDLVQGYLLGRPVPLSQLDLTGANWPREIVAHPQPANRDDDRRIELRLARSPPLPGNRARRS
jgi:EAL domain-containing protein (putative c-di-GMP-specific phosphodiesterase class I)